MKTVPLLTLVLLGLSGVATGGTLPTADTTGAMPVPANRIVGLWDNVGQVAPCGQPLNPPFRNLNAFSAGGTLSGDNSFPLAGVPSPWGLSARGPMYGTWRYDLRTGRYYSTGRFYWFVNGVFHGWNHVTREIDLSPDGRTFEATIRAQRYFVNGDPPVDICGFEHGYRVD